MTDIEEDDLSILLVEDDALDAELLVAALERGGLRFTHRRVVDAENFKARLAQGNWDLILSDYSLPVFGAEEVLDILKASDLDIPCIVISGYIGEEVAVSLMKSGAHDFVPKGNLTRLIPAIRREVVEAHNRRDKRNAEKSLKHTQKLITGVAEALGEGLVVSNAQCEIIFINPEAQRLLGWDQAEILGRNMHHAIHYLKADGTPYPEEECPVVIYTRQGVRHSSEDEVFVRKDGSIFQVSYISTPIIEDGTVAAVVTSFHDITRRKQAENELNESRRTLRGLSNFLQNIREEERTRIARELHDELGQALTALKMDLSWMIQRFDDKQGALLAKTDSMMALIDSTVDSVRRIAANLRPGLLDDLGLAAAVEWLLEDFHKRTGVNYSLEMSHDEFDFEPELSTTVFRILQEATTNAARYARATRLSVELSDLGDSVLLTVRDDGVGFDPASIAGKRKSFGLLGIRERVTSLGGCVEIISQACIGTELKVKLPKAFTTSLGWES
ncbi:MAG: histidine kinase [Methylomonas sp.]